MLRRSSTFLIVLGSFILITQITILLNQQNTKHADVKTENNESLFQQFETFFHAAFQKNRALEKQLILTSTKESIQQHQRYLTTSLASVPAAGLGNVLFELISLLGIADQLNRIPYISVTIPPLIEMLNQKVFSRYPRLLEQFQLRFPEQNATNVFFNNEKCCAYDDVDRLKNVTSRNLILSGVYFQSFKYFHHMRETVRNVVTPSLQIQEAAKQVLPDKVYKTKLICVHVRRGDFQIGAYHNPTDENFTITAIEDLSKKYSEEAAIVIMGNDAKWERNLTREFKNIHVLENTSPEMDFSFSQQFCDTLLITAPSSTFGFWLGYLAKHGATVYYRDLIESGDQVIKEFVMADFYPPDWIKLNFVNNRVVKL